jgi:bifunctional DNA-binding transcriptional regulator/antitoxin component of YhaV-PrlF toxin-antitoxin module
MAKLTIRNTRQKVSPGGVITLPVSARKALGMARGEGASLSVAVDESSVVLAPTGKDGGFRVSPKGQFVLRGDALKVVGSGAARHYWFEADDESRRVTLHPFE